MARVCLGVGCERKPLVLIIRPTLKPLLLFRHCRGIHPEKSKDIEIKVENVIVQLSRLRLTDDLPHFVESLQSEQAVGAIGVRGDIIRGQSKSFAVRFRRFLPLP
jgi:spermidine/putrescine-binding protein